MMKPGAWLLNFGRGHLIKDDDLIAAVKAKKIAGAVLDVFRQEPLPAEHPFWTHRGHHRAAAYRRPASAARPVRRAPVRRESGPLPRRQAAQGSRRPRDRILRRTEGEPIMIVRLAASLLVASALLPALAAAQAYPSKPVKIIAPVQPGGGVDLVGRTIGDRLGKRARTVVRRRELRAAAAADRRPGDGARRARRLHADGRLRRHARHQSGGAQAALRRGQGLHADRDGRRHAEHARGAAVGAGDDLQELRRLREERTRASCVRLRRHRHAQPSRDGAVQGRGRPRRVVHVHYRGIGPAITDILGGQIAGAVARARRGAAAHPAPAR